MKEKRLYELVYVVAPTATEQEVSEIHEQIEATIGRFEGKLSKTENWGRRKLAYEIAGHKEATYVLELIEGTGEMMKEIDRRLKVNEQVIRRMAVRVDEELRAAERSRSRRQAEAERRAARSAAAHPAAAAGEEPPPETAGEQPEAQSQEEPVEGASSPESTEA